MFLFKKDRVEKVYKVYPIYSTPDNILSQYFLIYCVHLQFFDLRLEVRAFDPK